MKITEETPDTLRLDYIPWGISLALVAFVLLFVGVGIAALARGDWGSGFWTILFGGGIGGVALVLFAERTQFVASRPAGTVALRRRTLRGFAEERRPLTDIAGAVVEVTRRDVGDRHVRSRRNAVISRPALVLTDGSHLPLRAAYATGDDAARAVAAIERWLRAQADGS